ncbi:cytochrome P450 2B6 [Folsomia candida]|uniref:cytochrome P450 2B6 n=1 Tax=Folsomia candida TaxID=158441 RepID=UPI000B9044F9|nr:cytochrome P450 2B6 [Folsomia candida]
MGGAEEIPPGVAHGDELHYLFKFDDEPYTDTEQAISSKMIEIFYSFMLYGKPTGNNSAQDEPPGPRALPVLGNLLDLARASDDMTKMFGVLSEKWGEIYTVKIGSKKTVVLTSKESMQKVLTDEGSYGRDLSGMMADRCWNKNLGIAFAEGEIWEKSRIWTFKTLKHFGLGKSTEVENYVKRSSEPLFTEIDKQIGSRGAVDVELLFSPAILSIIWQLVVGRISRADEPAINLLSYHLNKFALSSAVGAGLVNAFPVLRYIFPRWTGYKEQMAFFNASHEIAKNLYAESELKLKSSPDAAPATNMLDAFVQNCVTEPSNIFNCLNFQLIFMDLFGAGTETTSTFMEACVLYLISYPHVQEKVYQEILRIAPDGRPLNFSDRQKYFIL